MNWEKSSFVSLKKLCWAARIVPAITAVPQTPYKSAFAFSFAHDSRIMTKVMMPFITPMMIMSLLRDTGTKVTSLATNADQELKPCSILTAKKFVLENKESLLFNGKH